MGIHHWTVVSLPGMRTAYHKEENGNIGWTLNLHFAVFNIFFWLEMSALKNTVLQLCIYDFIFTIKF